MALTFKTFMHNTLKTALVAMSLSTIVACQQVATAPKADLGLQNPERNVLCDQYVCANSEGLSKALTAKYLGESQALKVFSGPNFDHTQFTFANGIFCDTKEQRCYVDRYFNQDGQRSAQSPAHSKALFQ